MTKTKAGRETHVMVELRRVRQMQAKNETQVKALSVRTTYSIQMWVVMLLALMVWAG